MKHSDTTKAKLSAMRRGENNPFYGRKHSPETKALMSARVQAVGARREYSVNPQSIRVPEEPTAFGYLAGIIDGEGSIRFAGGRPFVAVYNTDERLMAWLVANVGGAYKPSDRRGRSVCHCWRVGAANDVSALCSALLPRLLIKRDDAERVITHLRKRYG